VLAFVNEAKRSASHSKSFSQHVRGGKMLSCSKLPLFLK